MTHPLMQFFSFGHLPQHMQAASQMFHEASTALDALGKRIRGPEAESLIEQLIVKLECLPDNVERREAARKLRSLLSAVHAYPNGEGGMGKSEALRELLEAKDCAVRAVLYKEPADG